jgi:hypothetical protein
MLQRKATGEPASQPRNEPAKGTWPVWLKGLVSGLIALHLTAMFVAPFAFACSARGSSSPFADALLAPLRPYIVALYLDHGYFFFAPDPGPSRLVDYRVEFADGRPAVTGRFPNLATERPRLLYHRHFMLSEALSNRFVPPKAPPEPSPPPLTAGPAERAAYQLARAQHARSRAIWQRQRSQYEAMRSSIADHLKAQYGGDDVRLTRIDHRPALPDEVQAAQRELNAADSYRELPESPGEERR